MVTKSVRLRGATCARIGFLRLPGSEAEREQKREHAGWYSWQRIRSRAQPQESLGGPPAPGRSSQQVRHPGAGSALPAAGLGATAGEPAAAGQPAPTSARPAAGRGPPPAGVRAAHGGQPESWCPAAAAAAAAGAPAARRRPGWARAATPRPRRFPSSRLGGSTARLGRRCGQSPRGARAPWRPLARQRRPRRAPALRAGREGKALPYLGLF